MFVHIAENCIVTAKCLLVAERLSARHLIREYGLVERIYVCMSVTLRNAIINAYAHACVYSINVLYLLLVRLLDGRPLPTSTWLLPGARGV